MRRLVLLLLPALALACAPGERSPGGGASGGGGRVTQGGQAEEAFLALASRVEARPELATRLATAARRLHRQAEAVVALERALVARPEDPDLLFVTAALEMDLERRGRAEERLRRALEIDPGHVPSVVQLCAHLAEAYRWREALVLVTAAEERIRGREGVGGAPEEAERHRLGVLLVQKARLLLALGRTEAALATSEEAAVLDPAYGEASYGLGLALIAAGRLEEAAAALAAARRADPDHLEAAYQEMNVAERLGREAAAREARTRFEDLYRRHLRAGAGPAAPGEAR
jgi:tetratricopeptide (TPR) repeat protein